MIKTSSSVPSPLLGFVTALMVVACGAAVAPDAGPTDPGAGNPACDLPADLGPRYAFVDVLVDTYDAPAAAPGQTVIVRDGTIEAVGAGLSVPDGYVEFPGCGRTLSPGLADMHVHLSRADLPLYLDHGVTKVRNLWGFTDLLAMQREVEAGTLEGPSIHVISSGLDGTPAKWPFTQFVHDSADALRVVDEQMALGYRTLKLYQDLRPEPFQQIVDYARAQGLDYGGHVPHRVGLPAALDAGYRFIEHLSGWEVELNPSGGRGAFAWSRMEESRIPGLVQATVEAGTWNSPTLAIFSALASGDEVIVRNRGTVVKALYDAGAPLLVGTDSGIDVVAPGRSLHDELALFRAAGIPGRAALAIATLGAAEFLGIADSWGRVAVGYEADLVLSGQAPSAAPQTLLAPLAVIARGVRVR